MKALIISEKLGTDAARCSTYIALEAVRRGHEVYECYADKISLLDGEIICEAARFLSESQPDAASIKYVIKQHFDVVFFRPNPPVDMAYLTTLYMLQIIENDVLILNQPSAVIKFPEKILPHYFAEFSPPTLISKNRREIIEFVKNQHGAIAKPLYWFGGTGIEKIAEDDIESIDRLLGENKEPLVYQKFLPEVVEGDKRLIFVNFKYIGAFNRVPLEGKFIANLSSGGQLSTFEPNDYQKTKIIPKVEKFLADNNIAFCGIDVIGKYVTEMNITSPAVFTELIKLYAENHEQDLWDELENRLSK